MAKLFADAVSRLARACLRVVPPRGVVALGRLRRLPVIGRPLRAAAVAAFCRRGTIRAGLGAGLAFDAAGGSPGYLLGCADEDEQAALGRFLKPGQVFYDIGANVGFFSLLGARLVGPAGRVCAFEPYPAHARAIRHNAALNGFANVEVFEAAVSSAAGRAELLPGDGPSTHRLAGAGAAPPGSLNVEQVSVDDLVAAGRLRGPDFIKIDVEGHEIEVLRGLARTAARFRPALLVEIHWLIGEVHRAYEEVFRPLGYRLATLDGSPLPERPVRYHVLLVPPGG